MGKRAKATPDEQTADPPADEPPAGAELDVAAMEAWRAKTLTDIEVGNSVVLHALAEEEIETVGQIIDLYEGHDPADAALTDPLELLPFNLTQGQTEALHAVVAASLAGTGLDPAAVLPWHRPAAEPQPETPPEAEADVSVILIDPASPEALAKYDAETARLVAAAERNVNELEGEWEDLHGRAAIAKKEFEQARDKTRALIRERDANRGVRDLFTQIDGNSAHPPADPAPPASEDRLAELMMKYPLTFGRWEKYGLTEKDCEKLTAGETKHHGTIPLYTYGDIGRFVKDPSSGFERRLTDIKGIGEAAYNRWLDAELKFQQDWPNIARHFAAEIGFDLGAADEARPGPGGGDGEQGGDGEATPGEAAAIDTAAEQPPERLKANPETGELETVGSKPKRKPKAKAKSRGR